VIRWSSFPCLTAVVLFSVGVAQVAWQEDADDDDGVGESAGVSHRGTTPTASPGPGAGATAAGAAAAADATAPTSGSANRRSKGGSSNATSTPTLPRGIGPALLKGSKSTSSPRRLVMKSASGSGGADDGGAAPVTAAVGANAGVGIAGVPRKGNDSGGGGGGGGGGAAATADGAPSRPHHNRPPRPDDFLDSVRMDREQRQRMAMIDSALDALRIGFAHDRSGLITPIKGTERTRSEGSSDVVAVASATPGESAGGGSCGRSIASGVGGGSASARSAISAATVSRGVKRQDIVVVTVKAREQLSGGQLADRSAIDALLQQLKREIPLDALPPPPAPASSRNLL
jgi:hypothetical protein